MSEDENILIIMIIILTFLRQIEIYLYKIFMNAFHAGFNGYIRKQLHITVIVSCIWTSVSVQLKWTCNFYLFIFTFNFAFILKWRHCKNVGISEENIGRKTVHLISSVSNIKKQYYMNLNYSMHFILFRPFH